MQSSEPSFIHQHDSQGNKEMHMTRAARHTTLQKRWVGFPSSAQQPNKNALCNTPTTFCRYSNYMGEATNEAVGDGLLYAQTAVTLLRATHHMVYTLRRETKLRRSALCAAARPQPKSPQHRNSFCTQHNRHHCCCAQIISGAVQTWSRFSICCPRGDYCVNLFELMLNVYANLFNKLENTGFPFNYPLKKSFDMAQTKFRDSRVCCLYIHVKTKKKCKSEFDIGWATVLISK